MIASGAREALHAFALNWESLKGFENKVASDVSKWALLAIPIAASAVDYLQRLAGIIIHLPVSLIAAYFAALLYFSGLTILKFFCPKNVATFKDFRDCAQDVNAQLSGIMPSSAQASPIHPGEDNSQDALIAYLKAQMALETPKEVLGELLRSWEQDNVSHPYLRGICQIFFFVSAMISLYLVFVDAPIRVYRVVH